MPLAVSSPSQLQRNRPFDDIAERPGYQYWSVRDPYRHGAFVRGFAVTRYSRANEIWFGNDLLRHRRIVNHVPRFGQFRALVGANDTEPTLVLDSTLQAFDVLDLQTGLSEVEQKLLILPRLFSCSHCESA